MLSISFLTRFILITLLYYLNINDLLKVILIILTDNIDCVLFKYFNNKNCKNFSYQISDKILDLYSYFLIYKFLNLNTIYLYIILYRLIGVLLFSLSAQSIYLVVFPDIFKEVLLYNYIFGELNYGIIIVIILKIMFEYYWHSVKNPISYR